jgi:hypothetical protein
MDKKLKTLIGKLGQAIHEAVIENPQVAEIVGKLREAGYETLVMLDATIALSDVEEAPTAANVSPAEHGSADPESFTTNDLSFLRSLRIGVTGIDADAKP